jgi:class 3 adenylate cyclase/predicted ATPase
VQCPACHTENTPGVRFCVECGEPQAVTCTRCEASNPLTSRFCGQCGGPLREGAQAGAGRESTDASAERAELRQLTVMFCDVVGSTTLSEELDPEELRALVKRYQQVVAEAIKPYGGHIAQYYGDGLLIYFGYPTAHEDDAVNAVRAGLAIVSGMAEMERPLAARIGIHTGDVVAGEVGAGERREQLAIGKTPNLTAHLQAEAEPDTVVVSEDTYRLVEGYFNFAPLGPKRLKGIAEPVLVHQVLEESGVHGRFELTVQRGLSPLVGREEELELLAEKFRESAAGSSQAVLVRGEAGMGKSRLVHSFREEKRTELTNWWVYRCTPYTQDTSFYPVIEMIHHQLALDPEDSPEEKIDKLEARADAFGLSRTDIVPLVAALVDLPLEGRYPPLVLSPQLFKEKALEFFVSFILQRTTELPVVFFMEDLHWVDPSTLEFLDRLLARATDARLLILFTARPEFQCPWSDRDAFATLDLRRLRAAEIARLVSGLANARMVAPELIKHLVNQSDGVPLYVEEMTKSMLDSDFVTLRGNRYELAADRGRVHVPATLRDSLTARLDRLGSAKEAAQIGSALGREFSFDLLVAVASQDATSLQQDVDRLVEAELVYRRAEGMHAVYIFKHALVQEAAHHSMLRTQREALHRQIASVLKELFPAVASADPALMAYHHEEAGEPAAAAGYLLVAAQMATQRSAYAEAVSQCRRGLHLLDALARTPEHLETELALRAVLGVGLVVTLGYAAEEVAENAARSEAACAELGETPHLVPSLYGLWVYHLLRGHRRESHELAERISRLASDDEMQQLIGSSTLGTTALYDGRFQDCREHMEAAMPLFSHDRHAELAQSYGDEADILPHVYHYWCLWILGEPEAAIAHKGRAMRIIEALGSPYVLATGLLFEMILAHELRDTSQVRAVSTRFLELAQEQRYVFFETLASVGHGWALCHEDRIDEGIAQMQAGLDMHTAIGTRLPHAYWQHYMLEVLLGAGRTEEGLACAASALEDAETRLDVYYDAELHRLRGELLLQDGRPADAEAAYAQALEIARATGARAFELRAATSLARLFHGTERAAEGRQVLEPACAAFPQELSLPDLGDARSLLLQLE